MQFTGKVEVNPRFRTISRLMDLDRKDLGEILKAVDFQFRENERRLFATEGTSGGSKWQRLSSKYAAIKARRFPGRKILAARGTLRKDLTTKSGRHLAFVSMKPPSVTVGADNEIGRHHSRGLAPLPRRNPIQMTNRQRKRFHAIVKRWLTDVKLGRVKRALRWRGSRVR